MLTTTVTGSSTIAHLGDGALARLDQRPALVAVRLGVGLDLADHGALQRRRAGEDLVQLRRLGAQLLQLLLDPDRLEPRQLAQADVEDVVGLALAEREALDQRRLRLVGGADDRDHLVDVEQDELAPFEDVDPVGDLGQPMARAPLDGRERGTGSIRRAAAAGSSASAGRRRRPSSG